MFGRYLVLLLEVDHVAGWQDSSKEAVESGDEQYFPALQIGPTNSISSVVRM